MEEIAEWLSQKHGSKVGITVPQRGDRAQLVAMCKSNAAETLAQKKGATVREYNVLEELRDLLGLKKLPEYIESYDISNLAGTENVAGMIVYKTANRSNRLTESLKSKALKDRMTTHPWRKF